MFYNLFFSRKNTNLEDVIWQGKKNGEEEEAC
jgi:hypothetical protein